MKTLPTVGKKLNDPVLQIKKFKHYAGMSEETEAFSGELYMDGKFLAHVKNDGHGGCNHISAVGDDRERLQALAQACRELPNVASKYIPEGLKTNLDFLISVMVNELLDQKHMKAQLRGQKLGFRVAGETYDKGAFHVFRGADTPDNRKKVEARYKVGTWMSDLVRAPLQLKLSELHACASRDEPDDERA